MAIKRNRYFITTNNDDVTDYDGCTIESILPHTRKAARDSVNEYLEVINNGHADDIKSIKVYQVTFTLVDEIKIK